MKLRNKQPKHNVKAAESSKGECLCFNTARHVAVSFEYLTDDSRYNFDYFGDNVRSKANAYEKLYELLTRINQSSWVELSQLNKYKLGGFETLAYGCIRVAVLKKASILTPETRVYSFRFAGNDYRLLGFKTANCHILYVVGFDFDYSAYDHGS